MEEKTNIEKLREIAKATNRTIDSMEIPYPVSGIRTFQKFKRMIFIPNNARKTSYFVWFSDPYAKAGYSTIFCGAFIPLKSNIKSRFNIRNKNILDKINIFSSTKENRVGNYLFDSRVVITGNIESEEKRFLSKSRIQKEFLKALEIDSFINITINEYKLDFVPELKNNPYLGIINPQSWNLEKDYIENLFNQIERIRDIID